MRIVSCALFAALTVVLINGCSKEETFPATPQITFKSLSVLNSSLQTDSVELIFSFVDGDGDLGTPATDILNRDIFVKIFELRNGVFVEPFLPAPLEYKLPYLEPGGNNKSLKGDVKINVDYNVGYPNDTIRYTVYIKDRAGHISNTITTSVVITGVQ